ncbi:MAG: hypothetical protein ABEJ73_06255 [Haloplanus sp.]
MQNGTRAEWHAVDGNPEPVDFDRYTSYEEATKTVVCDRRNARAWISADTVVALDP